MGYFSMRAKQILGLHRSPLVLIVYKKGWNPDNPDERTLPVHSLEQGKVLCDEMVTYVEVDRVELVDNNAGECIYARGYRALPKAPRKEKADQAVLFPAGGSE